MFYSHSLISKKGPLGTIWLAAYCHKKLKKEQIARTNIASSIDKIIIDVHISYRILAQLLLGIVRIYSKKVDFLHHECNEALLRIRKAFLSSPRYIFERTVCAPSYKETTRKPVPHGRRGATIPVENEAVEVSHVYSPEKTARATSNISIIIPENFQLDAFDLGIQEQGDDDNVNQQLQLEGEECDWRYSSNDHYNQATTDLFFDGAQFTPARDVLDVSFETYELHSVSTTEPRGGEDLQPNLGPSQGHETFSRGRRSLNVTVQDRELDEPEHHADLMEIQESEHRDIERAPTEGQEKPRDRELDEPEHQADMMEVQESEHRDIERVPTEGQEKPRGRELDEPEHHTDIMEVQQKEHQDIERAPTEGQEKPRTPMRTQQNSNVQLAAASPEFVVSTPAKKERQKFSRKRKCLFDEEIVLSNETLRRAIHDPKNLVLKRRKAPHTCLDFWKAEKFSNLQKAFEEPLIRCEVFLRNISTSAKIMSESGYPSRKRTRVTSSVKELVLHEQVEGVDASMEYQAPITELNEETPVVASMEYQAPITELNEETPVVASMEYQAPITELNEETPVVAPMTGGFTETRDNTKLRDTRHEGVSSEERPDLELSLDDQVSSSMEEGMSHRAQKESGLHEEFNLSKVLEGRKRRACAILFYETLVLKTHGVVDVKQEVPYSDIFLSPTPNLRKHWSVDP